MYPNMMYLLLKGQLEISAGSRVITILISEVRGRHFSGNPFLFNFWLL